jgi:hypothetical protein
MSTGVGVQVMVDLLEKTVTYNVNILLQLAYRIEGGRGLSGAGYMSRLHETIERGFRTWISEQKLLMVRFELYNPASNEAYEVAQVDLTYTAEPTEKVVKPPIEQLETLMKKLTKLPADATFNVIVRNAPGASEVPGWTPSAFKELMGGVSEEIEVGNEEHGFGHVWGKVVYLISNGARKQQDQHNGVNK